MPAELLGSSDAPTCAMSVSLMRPPTSPSRPAKRRELLERVVLDGGDVALGVLGDEHEVDESDRVALDQVSQRRSDLSGEFVARKADDEIFDRSDVHTDLLHE